MITVKTLSGKFYVAEAMSKVNVCDLGERKTNQRQPGQRRRVRGCLLANQVMQFGCQLGIQAF